MTVNYETLLLAEMDQLTAGLQRNDPAAIDQSRKMLALLSRDATPGLMLWIFRAIVGEFETPDP